MSDQRPTEEHPAPRGGRGSATRAAILEAARASFGAAGYDQVGVREVAARAGVDAALVIRYFGSKDALFTEAVGAKFDLTPLFDAERATLGERLVRYVLEKPSDPSGFDPLVALLRSSPSERPADLLRASIRDGFVLPLASRLTGPDAVARAELIGSVLLGLLIHRKVVGGASSEAETMVAVAAPAIQRLVDGVDPAD